MASQGLRWCMGLVLLGMVPLLGWGCGGSKILPSATAVTGTVQYQGKPLAGATVTFSAKEGNLASGRIAMGTTDAQGRFRLQSYAGPTESVEGSVPGTYRVTVSKYVPPQGMSDADYQAKVKAEEEAMQKKGIVAPNEKAPQRIELLPAKYSDPQKSQLSATVAKDGKNDFSFDLK